MDNEKSICRELKMINNLIRRKMMKSAVHEYIDSVTGTNGWIIAYIADHCDREVYQKDLEGVFSMRRSSVSKAIDTLEDKGFIRREAVERDARLKRLVLTEKAWEIHELAKENGRQIEAQVTRGLSEEEKKAFFSVLQKIKNNVEGEKNDDKKTGKMCS